MSDFFFLLPAALVSVPEIITIPDADVVCFESDIIEVIYENDLEVISDEL